MEPVAAPVVQGIFSSLLDTISRQIEYLTKLRENVGSLKNKIRELATLKDDVVQSTEVSELQQVECRNTVKDWLDEVESLQGEVATIEADFELRRSCLQACYPDCCTSSYKLDKKIVKKIVEVAELISKGKEFETVADMRLLPAPADTIPSISVAEADLVMMRVLNELKQEEVSIIGLYGVGGVGKTTLLNKIHNGFVGTKDFDTVIYTVVNKDVNIEEIQESIYKKLERQARHLHKNLCNLKYMLLLDNIWESLDLDVIRVPESNAQNKCKVVFATRNEEVCGSMGAHRTFKIEVLEEADAWNLFQEKVGEWVLSCPSVLPLAQEVAKKCGGLPLALITVGRAMTIKKTLLEWRNAEQELCSSPLEVKGMDNNVFSLLKYSYDCLQDDATKLCFLYCSFFPESSDIKIEDAIRYCIGEGYLDGIESYMEAYDRGCDVLGSLKKACLLEGGYDGNRFVRMHDVIHEMALWVASEFGKKGNFLLRRPFLISEESGVDEWKDVERAFLRDKGIRVLPESPVCPNLSTLILSSNRDLMNVSHTFFQFMHALRVLDLSTTGILSLPRSFSVLENLRYLNLSQTGITELPKGIEKLIKLQHLDLSCTKIRELPIEMERLIKLQHLDLSWTELENLPKALGGLRSLEHLNLQNTMSLQTIPHSTISKLYRLKELKMLNSFTKWELKRDGSGAKLEELESLKHLTTIEITVANDRIFHRFSQSAFLLKCTKYLEIKNFVGLSKMPLCFAGMDVLHSLVIDSCQRLNKLFIGSAMGENFLSCLQELWLFNLQNLNSIWEGMIPQGCLRNLHSLKIQSCDKLKSLRWVHNLPYLNELHLWFCDEMEEILGDDEVVEDIIFPKLQLVDLCHLPKLTSFYHRVLVFPSLVLLYVDECPRLKRLPLDAHSARKLKRISGERSWMESLEWEDEETMKALLPLFLLEEEEPS